MAHQVEPQEETRRRSKSSTTTRFNFKQRNATLKKKAAQLSKLCDVEVAMVCFGPDRTVETWPENRSEVCDIISNYKARLGGDKAGRENHNLLGFLGSKKMKLEDKSNKTVQKNNTSNRKKNLVRVCSTWDEKLDKFSEEQLVGFCSCLDSKLQNLREKIELKKNEKAIVVHSDDNINTSAQVYQSNPSPLLPPLCFNGDYSYNQQAAFSDSDIDDLFPGPDNFGISGQNYGINNDLLQGYGFAGESSNGKAVVVHSDDNLNTSDQVYQSNPSPLLPPFCFNGDYSYNQQAVFLGSDTNDFLPGLDNFGISGQNYEINNDLLQGYGFAGESINGIHNDLLQGYGFAGESSNINNDFPSSDTWINSQDLYEILPIKLRPSLPFHISPITLVRQVQ